MRKAPLDGAFFVSDIGSGLTLTRRFAQLSPFAEAGSRRRQVGEGALFRLGASLRQALTNSSRLLSNTRSTRQSSWPRFRISPVVAITLNAP